MEKGADTLTNPRESDCFPKIQTLSKSQLQPQPETMSTDLQFGEDIKKLCAKYGDRIAVQSGDTWIVTKKRINPRGQLDALNLDEQRKNLTQPSTWVVRTIDRGVTGTPVRRTKFDAR